MKSRNKLEKEWQKGLTGLQGQKPCKNLKGKRQKFEWWSLEPTRRERKEKNYLKRTLKKSKFDLFKKLIHEFRLVKNHPRSVETDRDSLSSNFKNFRSVKMQNGPIELGRGSPYFLRKTQFLKKQNDLTQSIEI